MENFENCAIQGTQLVSGGWGMLRDTEGNGNG